MLGSKSGDFSVVIPTWHNYLVLVSFIAAIAGLSLLFAFSSQTPKSESEATEEKLMRMTFSYWMIYCISVGIQKVHLPEWELLASSLRLATVVSYLLTFTCIITLPLHHIATFRDRID